MLAPTPNSRPSPLPLPAALLAVELGQAVMADDPCEAAFTGEDPTGPRKYYRARYYDPKIGRFISEDPISFAAGDSNFYAYAVNSPANYRDPSGLCPLCVAVGLGLAYVLNNPTVANTTTGPTTEPIVSNVGLTVGAVGGGVLAEQLAAGGTVVADALSDPNATRTLPISPSERLARQRALMEDMIRERGGAAILGPGGKPPANAAEANANLRHFLEELERRLAACRPK